MLLYKFRSGMEFKRVALDKVDNVKETAMFVRTIDVKKAIASSMMGPKFVQSHILGGGNSNNSDGRVFATEKARIKMLQRRDFELKLFNAKTGEEYVDDTKFVPTTSVAEASQRFTDGKATDANELFLSSDNQNNVLLLVERSPVQPGHDGLLVRWVTQRTSSGYTTTTNKINDVGMTFGSKKSSSIYVIESRPDEEDEFYYEGDESKSVELDSSSSPSHMDGFEPSSAKRDQIDDMNDFNDNSITNTKKNPALGRLMTALLERSAKSSKETNNGMKSTSIIFGPVNVDQVNPGMRSSNKKMKKSIIASSNVRILQQKYQKKSMGKNYATSTVQNSRNDLRSSSVGSSSTKSSSSTLLGQKRRISYDGSQPQAPSSRRRRRGPPPGFAMARVASRPTSAEVVDGRR